MQFKTKFIQTFFVLLFVLTAIRFSAQTFGCQAYKKAQAAIYYSPENLRSDTFDILKLTVNLEIGNSVTKQIKGNTQIRFAPKLNNRTFIRFDLLKLTVDSVKENNSLRTFTHNDTILKVNFVAPKNITDTSVITVYYKGQPIMDATGWGGFYFDNTQGAEYAFNLGVGFGAKPHNYGRVWFPCFDNFVEKNKYEFNITNDSARRSYCNGQLVSDIVTGTKRTRKWVLNEEIPSYLASVSVANYSKVNWTVNTINGVKPIHLVAHASDTAAVKAGFTNLKNCITGFENYFGPYMWNRIGYCIVPFNSGAMEHATNITYPRPFIGNLAYESDLMAHELSHHWWGDLITCETQEDMWINEGMATFSSYLFLEWQYGKNTYLNKVKTTHDNLLHFLHKKEGFRAVSGVPHSITYGDHVYLKGADVAHTLRGYMGDVDFFNASKYAMLQKAYKNMNSTEMKNLFQTSSSQNLNDFFNNWVFAGGWPHFSVDSIRYTTINSNSVNAVVSLEQKLYGAPTLYNNVPLEITFFKNDWSTAVRKVVLSGATGIFSINLPFTPIMYALNYESKISDATSHEAKVIKATGNFNYALSKALLKVQNKGADSSLIRITHNYVKPDPFKNNSGNHRLSNQHYWTVEGIISPGFLAGLRFNYDGTKSTSGNFAYLDTLLTIVNGDSIALFHRANASADWAWVHNAVKFPSSSKAGFIEVDTLRLGEYTFGNIHDTTWAGIKEKSQHSLKVIVYPNPAKTVLTVNCEASTNAPCTMELIDMNGRVVLKKTLLSAITRIDLPNLSKGNYVVNVQDELGRSHSSSVLIE
ncbi:MAG: T9SS type A sorting domain-containing protein [Bacteroidia bacterium]|nr:T9SS type A sorting domain-containing protein [Bacteroidia bacterium]